jgi:hypothetical protein
MELVGGTTEGEFHNNSYACLCDYGFRLTEISWSIENKGTIFAQTCAGAPVCMSILPAKCEIGAILSVCPVACKSVEGGGEKGALLQYELKWALWHVL